MTDRGTSRSTGVIQVLLLGSIVLNVGLIFDLAPRATTWVAASVVVLGLAVLAVRRWRARR